jgi:transcriptional regulator with XRE-family HTH domain
MTKFSNWLDEELKSKNWSHAELARHAGVHQSTISMIYSGQRGVGPELINAIAHALKLPPETVFRAAGLLPSAPTIPDDLSYYVNALSDAQLREWMNYAKFILERDQNKSV